MTPQYWQTTCNQSSYVHTPLHVHLLDVFKDFSPKAFGVVEIACDLPSFGGRLHLSNFHLFFFLGSAKSILN